MQTTAQEQYEAFPRAYFWNTDAPRDEEATHRELGLTRVPGDDGIDRKQTNSTA